MNETDTFLVKLILVVILLSVFFFSPMILQTSSEKDVTIIYNDENGILDSCGNFYSSNKMPRDTITKLNYLTKNESDLPIHVTFKANIPNKNIPIASFILQHTDTYELINFNNHISQSNC